MKSRTKDDLSQFDLTTLETLVGHWRQKILLPPAHGKRWGAQEAKESHPKRQLAVWKRPLVGLILIYLHICVLVQPGSAGEGAMLQAGPSRGTWTCTLPWWAFAFIHRCMTRNPTMIGLFNIPSLKLMFLLYDSEDGGPMGFQGRWRASEMWPRVHVASQAHQKRSFILSSLQCPFMGSVQNTGEHQPDALLILYLWIQHSLWFYADGNIPSPLCSWFHFVPLTFLCGADVKIRTSWC